jgi:hypothetical protein
MVEATSLLYRRTLDEMESFPHHLPGNHTVDVTITSSYTC